MGVATDGDNGRGESGDVPAVPQVPPGASASSAAGLVALPVHLRYRSRLLPAHSGAAELRQVVELCCIGADLEHG